MGSKEAREWKKRLRALDSVIRINVLGFLAEGPNGFNEIGRAVGLNPYHTAGQIAYHLGLLMEGGLVAKAKTKVYSITPAGAKMLDWLKGWHEQKISVHLLKASIATIKRELEKLEDALGMEKDA